ncbi:MAG: HNH endonuclease [Candidatus Atribacteria bacterium]|nr:HNH endonuclease [Candidatus Atribacteria bacterium]
MNKKTRFEVFKRDNFKCQYCGRTPPEVILEIDHIIPKSKGGADDIENLITSCRDCNRGKGKNFITNIQKREIIKENLKNLKEKEEQLKEYYKLQRRQERKIQKNIQTIKDYWHLIDGKTEISEYGEKSIRTFLKSFSVKEIQEAINISSKIEDSNQRFLYMCGVLHNKEREKKYPGLSEIISYWRKLPKGSGYYRLNSLEEAIERYSIEEIKQAMNEAIKEPQSSYFRKFCEILDIKYG